MTASRRPALYYAFFSWGHRREVPENAVSFTYHKETDYGALVVGFVFLLLIETSIDHVFLARYSALIAWIATLASAQLAVWLVADYRSACLRPILLDEETLYARVGLRWDVDIPLKIVESLKRTEESISKRTPGYLKLVLFGEPQFLLVLKEPVVARGPFGLKKKFHMAGIGVDEPGRFEDELDNRLKHR